MFDTILSNMALVVLLGVGGQWLARRLRIPALLLLLVAGIGAGPLLGLISPAALQTDWAYALMALIAGLLLFEAGLHLRVEGLRDEAGHMAQRLIAVGGVLTAGLTAAAAYVLLDFSLSLSVLVGLLLLIAGPTVAEPLLRYMRAENSFARVARRESRLLEPVGALVAVLALEVVALLHGPSRAAVEQGLAAYVTQGVLMSVFVSVGVAVFAMGGLVLMLRRRLAPSSLRPALTLMVVVLTYVVAEALQAGGGLLAAPLLGILLANQPYVTVPRPMALEPNMRAVLVGILAVVLGAQVRPEALGNIDGRTLLFVGALIVAVRPVAVLVASLGSGLAWRTQALLAGLSPRGVLAVALTPLFALRLADAFPEDGGALVPVVFTAVIGTMAIYGLAARPLAYWTGSVSPRRSPDTLFIGASQWVRRLARVLQHLGVEVKLVDTNPRRIQKARDAGLTAVQADARSKSLFDEEAVASSDRVLVTLPNDAANSHIAHQLEEVVAKEEIYQLAAHPETKDRYPRHGRPLFGSETTFTQIEERFAQGHVVALFELSRVPEQLASLYQDGMLPLFTRRDETIRVVADGASFDLEEGDELIALVDEQHIEEGTPRSDAALIELERGEKTAKGQNDRPADVD